MGFSLEDLNQRIAARAEGFDMEIRYHNRRQSPDAPYAYEPSLAELARWCDFLVVATAGVASKVVLASAASGAMRPS